MLCTFIIIYKKLIVYLRTIKVTIVYQTHTPKISFSNKKKAKKINVYH